MQKIIEGNPVLVEEHPVVLDKGAYVYYYDTSAPMIEIPLNGRFDEDRKDGYAHGWSEIGAALIEVRRHNKYPVDAGHPSELVGEVRRFFRDNPELYEATRKEGQYTRLCIRPGRLHSLDRNDDPRGITTYLPRPRWTVQVISQEAMAYNNPGKSTEA